MSVLHPISKNTTTILDMMTMTPFLTSARRLLHYGVDAGDTEVVTKSNFTGEYVCPLIKVRNGFPIGGKLVYGLYVSIHQYFFYRLWLNMSKICEQEQSTTIVILSLKEALSLMNYRNYLHQHSAESWD